MKKKGGVFILIIGTILKDARIKNNLSLSELSRISDISKGELSKIENGKVKYIRGALLYRLCNILELDYDNVVREGWDIFPIFLSERKRHSS